MNDLVLFAACVAFFLVGYVVGRLLGPECDCARNASRGENPDAR